MDEDTMMDVLDRLRNRFFGKYRGVVTDVDAVDPAHQGQGAVGARRPAHRLVPALRALCGPGRGMAFLPEVGSGVWIEFERRRRVVPDLGRLLLARRRAAVRRRPGRQGDRHQVGPQDPARRRRETITISDPNNNTVTLSSDGITLQRGGNQIAISDSEVNVNDGALEMV